MQQRVTLNGKDEGKKHKAMKSLRSVFEVFPKDKRKNNKKRVKSKEGADEKCQKDHGCI